MEQAARPCEGALGQLTDDDLQIQGGNVDQLVGRIQQKTGEGREAIEKFLAELTRAARPPSSVRPMPSATTPTRRATGSASATERSEDMVRRNPAAVFGIGLVAGLIIGLAIRRR